MMQSNRIRFHKNDSEIFSVDDWFQFAPPKEGKKHWKDGRSAKELAKRWFPDKGSPQVPNELIELLSSQQELMGTIIIEGIPEHKIKLDNFRGETRNADLMLFGQKGDRRISISVEAKADEPFDQTIGEKIDTVQNKRSKIPERIDILCQSLFGKTPKELPALSQLRYQLLTGVAGALIEGKKRNAHLALFVVHVFMSSELDPIKVWQNTTDFNQFLQLLSNQPDLTIDNGMLVGPIQVIGGTFVPSDIPLYIGKISSGSDIL